MVKLRWKNKQIKELYLLCDSSFIKKKKKRGGAHIPSRKITDAGGPRFHS
jgi:hypothetical protein